MKIQLNHPTKLSILSFRLVLLLLQLLSQTCFLLLLFPQHWRHLSCPDWNQRRWTPPWNFGQPQQSTVDRLRAPRLLSSLLSCGHLWSIPSCSRRLQPSRAPEEVERNLHLARSLPPGEKCERNQDWHPNFRKKCCQSWLSVFCVISIDKSWMDLCCKNMRTVWVNQN